MAVLLCQGAVEEELMEMHLEWQEQTRDPESGAANVTDSEGKGRGERPLRK
jgi:hypothetical protein